MADFAQPSDGRRLTFNEFQRQLNNRKIDPNVAYMLTVMYEQLGDLSKQFDEQLKVMVELANHLQSFANLRVADQHLLRSLQKRVLGDGVDVASVANDPEKKN